MNRVAIPLDPAGFAGTEVPGWWPGDRDGQRVIHLRCGGCKRHAGTMDNHVVETDGEVNPSILCPEASCGWHVWGRLEGWTP